MRSALLLKLCIFVFVLIFIRYWAIQQIWVPAEEHIRQIERWDCTPDEVILNAIGKNYRNPFSNSVSMLVSGATKCSWDQKEFRENGPKECHLPMLIHAKHALLQHWSKGKEFIVGTKDCPLILWKREEQGKRQKFYAVWYKGDDGRIQWNVEPYEQETE